MLKLIALVIFLALAATVYWFYLRPQHKPGPPPTPPTAPRADAKLIILNQLQNAGTLVCATYECSGIVTATEKRRLLGIPIGRTKVMSQLLGKVSIGFHLDSLSGRSINVQDKSLQVVLPAPEILDITLDHQNSEVLDIRRTPLTGPESTPLYVTSEQQFVNELRAHAEANPVLQAEALQNAEHLLTSLLAEIGMTDVRVELSNYDAKAEAL